MSSDLLKRRVAARQRIKQVGGHSFTLRRPTKFELVKYASLTVLDYLCECVDDCDLTEADVVSNGSAEVKLPFDRALFRDWLYERDDLWGPLTEELKDMVKTHSAALEEDAKNSLPG